MRSLLLSALCVAPALAASLDDWRSRSIYQLVTDRFALADNSSPSCDTSLRQYCGGTWNGITAKLDYIQNMGFDALWISPVVANLDGNSSVGEAYHGYWTQDINSLNSHFGSPDDLKALASALHQRNMYLMLDVVVNHMAADSDPPDYSLFQPFATQSNFHSECFISDYNNQTDVEQCWLGDTNLPLVDLNTEDQDVVDSMYAWARHVVTDYAVDGIRIDTVKHVRKDFWPGFAKSAAVFTIGEVLHNDTSYVAPYTQLLDSVLDYPAWFSLVSAFKSTNGNMSELAETVWTAQATYKDRGIATGSFLDNHDQPRFQSLTTDPALIKNAMTWPFVQDGIPIVYYGQEQSYTGGSDPANREALWLSGYVQDKPLVNHIKVLNAARKAAIAANSSYLTTPATLYAVTPSTLAVSKPPMLALLTNSGNGSTPTWNVPDAGYQPGEALVDVLTCTPVRADERGGVMVQGSEGSPQILLPTTTLSKNGSLCSNMAGGASAGQASSAKRTAVGFGEAVAQGSSIGVALAILFIASHSSLLIG